MQHVDDHKRWLDLLEDLGLPPEEAPSPAPVVKAAPVVAAPPPPPAPVHVPEPEPVAEEVAPEPVTEEAPAVRGRRRRSAPASESATGEATEEPKEAGRVRRRRRVGKPAAASEADIVEDNGVGEELTPLPAEEISPSLAVEPSLEEPLSPEEEDVAPGPEAGPEGEGPTGEVRRRRRRRRRKPADAGEGAIKSPVVAAQASSREPLEEEPDFVDPSPSLADDLVSEDEEIGEEEVTGEFAAETPSALDEDADEFEDLTELNMPSWTELVASLYRPPDR